jgi:hypothetical protein
MKFKMTKDGQIVLLLADVETVSGSLLLPLALRAAYTQHAQRLQL